MNNKIFKKISNVFAVIMLIIITTTACDTSEFTNKTTTVTQEETSSAISKSISETEDNKSQNTTKSEEQTTKPKKETAKSEEKSTKTKEKNTEQDKTSKSSKNNKKVNNKNKKFTYKKIPKYDKKPYVEINGNIPYFSDDELTTTAFEKYSDLDSLGRCQVAYANICKELMPTKERGEIGHIKPSGWHTVKYPELIEDRYLYNRCHLIAYSLAGENDNEKNLITGTRSMNCDGMEPFELKVLDYVRNSKEDVHVLYRVTPIYKKSELVARGVLIEAMSVEDNGDKIKFCVFVYNVQKYITIDYATGESKANKEGQRIMAQKESEANQANRNNSSSNDNQAVDRSNNSSKHHYVLNTNTYKFHEEYCRSVRQMSDRNKLEYYGTREEVISMGYDPCQNCNP